MKQLLNITIFIFGIFFIPHPSYAQVDFNQTPDDGLGELQQNEFQEHFFEALKQEGIENYSKAVTALQKCLELDKNQAVVYFQLGKNHVALKQFVQAEEALKKATQMKPDNRWYKQALYRLYWEQHNHKKAIETLKELSKLDSAYKEELAELYVETKQYKEALSVIDDLDRERGYTPERDRLRNQVYEATGQKKQQIENLETRKGNNPDSEENYLKLIYRYSENNQQDKAFETAKKLLEINPDSEVVHMALYKFYLDEGEVEKAVNSMKTVVKSTEIKPEAKLKVLQDFMTFVETQPEYEPDLVEATTMISQGESAKTLSELGQYHLQKGQKDKALKLFQEAYKTDGNNFTLLKTILLLQLDLGQYQDVATKAQEALNSYPTQPILYLVNGVALNGLKQHKNAVETLEMGLDYLIDNPKMEMDFYKQLSKAHSALGNTQQAEAFTKKAEELKE